MSNDLRANILKARKAKSRLVSPSFLAETDTKTVEVRVMGVDRRAIVTQGANKDGEYDAAAYEALIVIETCFVPDSDDKVFRPEDLDTLKSMPADVLDELAAPALEINGLMIRSVQVAEKN